ncbi:hypothetical protein [Zhongshania aliphaticivorans]|uniref:hypothetical protein n=1 Tax=Zhongshania aliphaticivorans TaxID=1470434 RepID=UPI0012E61651|nr:hypothetical protein [Zhongshania aliphaticivorans]CAA0109935.1 Uncharacterised protein [Zhongshania aliphaticivorans]
MEKIVFALVMALSMTACGGSGGGNGGSNGSGNDGGNEGDNSSGYNISFSPPPLDPNMATIDGDKPDHEFSVGDRIDIYWSFVSIEKDGDPVESPVLYTAKVYLSEDEELIEEESSLLISSECSIPNLGFKYHCGVHASYRCVYDENAQMTCVSFSDEEGEGYENYGVHTMDMSTFLDTTPKAGYAHYEVCLKEHPNICDSFKHEVFLNGPEYSVMAAQ